MPNKQEIIRVRIIKIKINSLKNPCMYGRRVNHRASSYYYHPAYLLSFYCVIDRDFRVFLSSTTFFV